MNGLAQKLFLQQEERIPWIAEKTSTAVPHYLQKFYEKGVLTICDITLIQTLGITDEAIAFFIAHLALSTRKGHLCITETLPAASSIWQFTDDGEKRSIDREEAEKIQSLITSGARQIKKTDLCSIESGSSPIVFEKGYFYFEKMWSAKSLFLKHYKRIVSSTPTHSIAHDLKDPSLKTEQLEAIQKGLNNAFTIIAGGPGTGKTYTAGQLVKNLYSNNKNHGAFTAAFAAPTGKAAANLQKSIAHAIPDMRCQVKTLHSLLGIHNSSQKTSIDHLGADFILVDESSMIDVRIMAKLFESIKANARLVLLGDPYQLPPVEAGFLFADMVNHCSRQHLATLKTCLRAELQSISTYADHIKEGNSEEIITGSFEGIKRISLDEAIPYALNAYQNDGDNFRILTPMRKGPFGTENLNRAIYEPLRSSKVPIMVTRNDYKYELFNGETAVIHKKNPFSNDYEKSDYAVFSHERVFPALLLPPHELAYALSIHKSQGSEFEHILICLPKGAEIFGRELLYTAVTRAKCRVTLACDDETLVKTITNKTIRLSGLFH